MVAAVAIVLAVVGYPLIKQTQRTGSFAGGLEKFEDRIEPAVPWQMLVAYRRYGEQLENMQGMLHSASKIAPLRNLKDAMANEPATLVLVIGESTNRQRMSLYGYPRKPRRSWTSSRASCRCSTTSSPRAPTPSKRCSRC